MSGQHSDHVHVIDAREQSRFEIRVDDRLAGFAEYRRLPDRLVFTHTEIDAAYQGLGLGGKLAGNALESVRAEGLQVTPLCPYIAAYIHKHPEYVDLVDDAHSEQFSSPQS